MAHYQNEQQYPQYPPQPPHGQQNPTPGGYDPNGSPSPYAANGLPYVEHTYGNVALPTRHGSSAARPDEHFIAGQAPPAPPPRGHGSISGHPYTPQSPAVNQSGYNPQEYATSLSPASVLAGAQRWPNAPASNLPYNPADYSDVNLLRSSSAGGYQQGYSPAYPTAGQPLHMSSPPLYQTAGRPQSMHSSQRPTLQTSYPSYYTPPAPPPLPAIPGSAGDSPSDDWGRIPGGVNRYRSHRYHTAASPPVSSPPHRHSQTSSFGPMDASYPTSPDPPPPPPHSYNSMGRPAANELNSRPLPRLPSQLASDQGGYFSEHNANNYPETSVPDDLTHQILNLSGATPSPRLDSRNSDVNGLYLSSDSDEDAEALAGLEAMREADRQDEEDELRRQSGQGTLFSSVGRHSSVAGPRQSYPQESDIDVPPVDLGSIGGGFDARMSYIGNSNSLSLDRNGSVSALHGRQESIAVSSSGSMRRSGNLSENEGQYQVYPRARVDAYGTGGLADPTSVRRMSFDEGDEAPHLGAQGGPAELFYHPGMTNRPLPPPPSEVQRPGHDLRHAYSDVGPSPYSQDWSAERAPSPHAHVYPSLPPAPNRHTSLVNHSNTPPALTPIRAKTDAEERRKNQRYSTIIDSSGETTAAASAVTLDLPGLSKRYNPSKLSSRDFDRCKEPWALSAMVEWLKSLVDQEQYLKKQPLIDGLVALFTHKVSTMNIADAETLAARVIDELHASGTLVEEEEWLVFTDKPLTGVIFQLTGNGCYSTRLHCYKETGRCYSHHCQRTEKKIDLSTQSELGPEEDWADYYKIKKEDLSNFNPKEVERQNILHEIVQKEESYLRELNVLTSIYRDKLQHANPPLIAPKKLASFIKEVFGKADRVKTANEDHLLPQMKYRQQLEGPWVVGFSDIFREWIRKAKTAYIEYASNFPNAVFLMRQEMERNMLFRTFLHDCSQDPRSRRLTFEHYMKLPISRLQHLGLLLDTALKKSTKDDDEKRNLQIAIEEIKGVTHECDARVGDGIRKVELSELQYKLKLRPTMQRVELNLDHLGRELVYQGELLRGGNTKFTWLETHAILFDHFFVLAKTISEKSSDGTTKYEQYDVSRLPIPMDLLVLESRDDDPVIRSTLTGVTKAAPMAADLRLQKTHSKDAMPGLAHSATSTSLASMQSNKSAPPAITTLDGSKDDKIMYPFRLKHLGKETYTLYAPSHQNREEWCNKIVEAKTKHAHALFAQNAEPFKLRVIADSAFSHDGPVTGQRSIIIQGTPLDRAVREVEAMYVSSGRPGPVCRAKVNCATSFNQSGKAMVAVGTDIGVFVSELDNPRGWQKVVPNPKVTQIAVLEDFSLFLLISDKSLIAYHLDVVCPVGGGPPNNDSARRAPQKLSGSRDVGFFATGRMKDRSLVFYKKRDGISSTFKVMTVLEPVIQKSSEKKSRFPPLRSGKTEYFRDFDEFYIPTECMGINLFTSALAVSTQKGFEILTLDKKQPISIPDLEAPHVTAIAQKLAGQKPLGMFRLSEQEFLLVYEECAVYVNKHGDISRSVIMEFVGKARNAALYGPYVLLFDPDFVEIRNAQNGRLRQVIAGRDVKCLDDALSGGTAGKRTIKLALQHPDMERNQIVVELLLNEGLRE